MLTAPGKKPDFDALPLRIAMEHMLSHQQLALDKAAACFVVYAVGVVFEHLGPEPAQAVINTAIHRLEYLKKGTVEGSVH